MRAAILVLGLAIAAWIALAQAPAPPPAPEPPPQPIPYSHKHHVGTMKLKCNFCHENKDPGETMGLPVAAKCMGGRGAPRAAGTRAIRVG